jgi:hypothetical protein
VEFAIDAEHDFRGVGISVQFVGDVKIVQPSLQHKGGRTLEEVFGFAGRLDEQGVDRLPRGAVYDLHILSWHQWGGRFQMSVIGERQVTGGNGRNPSGRKVLIFFGYGRFLAK